MLKGRVQSPRWTAGHRWNSTVLNIFQHCARCDPESAPTIFSAHTSQLWPVLTSSYNTGGLKVPEATPLVLATVSGNNFWTQQIRSNGWKSRTSWHLTCLSVRVGIITASAKKSFAQILIVDSTWIDIKDTAFPLGGVVGERGCHT